LGEEESCLFSSLRPGSHTCAARADGPHTPADSPRGARIVRHPGTDGPILLPERPVPHLFPTSHADGPRRPGGQFARISRTVRPIAADGPTSLFKFSLI
jgi:hypothetical protein